MDPQSQASFIPKKPLVASVSHTPGHIGLLWVIGMLVFLGSAVAAGSAFLYQGYLQSAIQSENQQLAEAQAAYDPTVISNLIRLDQRITQAKTLIGTHLDPSQIFNFLQLNTLATVRFSSFSYAQSAQGIALSLSGEAYDFTSVALQSDAFSKSTVLRDVLFADVNLDPSTGHITFKVTATIDSSLLSYVSALSQGVSTSTASGVSIFSASTTASSSRSQ